MNTENTDDRTLGQVDFTRVTATMAGFGIELHPGDNGDIATANLNGTQVTFALLNSVLIIRADVPTDQETAAGDPTLHLACNHVNCHSFIARSTVVDRGEKLLLRTERDILVAAGMSELQLRTSLQEAVDGVLGAQTAVTEAAQAIREAAPTTE